MVQGIAAYSSDFINNSCDILETTDSSGRSVYSFENVNFWQKIEHKVCIQMNVPL